MLLTLFDIKGGTPEDDCARVVYNFYGAHNDDEQNRLLLDYAFCEILNNHRSTINTPLQSEVSFKSIKGFVSDNDTFNKVWKVGRTTSLTVGKAKDKLRTFEHKTLGNVKGLVVHRMDSGQFGKF